MITGKASTGGRKRGDACGVWLQSETEMCKLMKLWPRCSRQSLGGRTLPAGAACCWTDRWETFQLSWGNKKLVTDRGSAGAPWLPKETKNTYFINLSKRAVAQLADDFPDVIGIDIPVDVLVLLHFLLDFKSGQPKYFAKSSESHLAQSSGTKVWKDSLLYTRSITHVKHPKCQFTVFTVGAAERSCSSLSVSRRSSADCDGKTRVIPTESLRSPPAAGKVAEQLAASLPGSLLARPPAG